MAHYIQGLSQGAKAAALFTTWSVETAFLYNAKFEHKIERAANMVFSTLSMVGAVALQNYSLQVLEKAAQNHLPTLKMGPPAYSIAIGTYSFTKILGLKFIASDESETKPLDKILNAKVAVIGAIAMFILHELTEKTGKASLFMGMTVGCTIALTNLTVDFLGALAFEKLPKASLSFNK